MDSVHPTYHGNKNNNVNVNEGDSSIDDRPWSPTGSVPTPPASLWNDIPINDGQGSSQGDPFNYDCYMCQVAIPDLGALQAHLMKEDTPHVVCPLCWREFGTESHYGIVLATWGNKKDRERQMLAHVRREHRYEMNELFLRHGEEPLPETDSEWEVNDDNSISVNSQPGPGLANGQAQEQGLEEITTLHLSLNGHSSNQYHDTSTDDDDPGSGLVLSCKGSPSVSGYVSSDHNGTDNSGSTLPLAGKELDEEKIRAEQKREMEWLEGFEGA